MNHGYSKAQRITEISAIGLFAAAATGLAVELGDALETASAWGALGASIITGYVLADLVSGIVHWMADRYGAETTPLVGNSFIRPFREHHRDPDAIVRHDFIETNGSNCIVSAPCLTVAFFGFSATPDSLASIFLIGSILSLCLAVFGTNQFHKWAHAGAAPRPIQFLGRAGVILGSRHHDIHHTSPFQKNYCITSGWWNPALERIQFFAFAEGVIEFVTGARPVDARREEHVLPLENCTHGS
jgi:ubiquitin-conjugating enzyme E2 variant